MEKIVEYSNWCWIDRLNGTDLVNGETLHIQWPDGHNTIEKIVVETDQRPYLDMGRTYNGLVQKAYVVRNINGIEVKVPICGLMAARMITGKAQAKKKGPETGALLTSPEGEFLRGCSGR